MIQNYLLILTNIYNYAECDYDGGDCCGGCTDYCTKCECKNFDTTWCKQLSELFAFPNCFYCDLFRWKKATCFVGIKSNLLLLIFNYPVQSVVWFVGVGEGGLNC